MTSDRVVVVGAGAAGIAAARRLRDSGYDALLVEASGRPGGRARSVSAGGYTVDAGCGWLHSAARNPWVGLAAAYGFAIDRSSPNWDVQWRDLGYPPEEQRRFDAAWTRFEERARALASGHDRPLSDAVPDPEWRAQFDAISGYANGAPLSRVSLHDWLAYEDRAGEDNWALPAGYGTLVARHAEGVPIRLGCHVGRVDRSGATLRLATSLGTIEAQAAIVAVPASALAHEAIRFTPALPDKHAAAAALPLGLADKVFLRVDAATLPPHTHLIGDPHRACTASHRLFPFGWPLIESFFGGDCAEALEAEGDGAAAAFAIEELVALLGSDWRARLVPVAGTAWRREPHIHGSYSHASVGNAGQRAVLAAPVDDRLFFAGEACHAFDFSTAHGAYQTGIATADALMAVRTPR